VPHFCANTFVDSTKYKLQTNRYPTYSVKQTGRYSNCSSKKQGIITSIGCNVLLDTVFLSTVHSWSTSLVGMQMYAIRLL